MLIFVYGDDGVRAKEKLLELTTRFAEKFDPTGLNFAEFSAASSAFSFPSVMQAITSAPFLGEKRMVVLRGLMDGLKKDDARMWAEGLQRTPTSTITVLVDVEPKATIEKHELFKLLQGQAEVHAYAGVKREGAVLAKWLVDEAAKKGASLALDVANELVARVGGDMWQLEGEVAKLAAYAAGGPITRETLDMLVRSNTESNIFAFVDAMSQREAKKAMQFLQEERDAGSADFYLLTMLARQVRILLQIRMALTEDPGASAGVAKRLNLHPFVAGKATVQAKRFTLPQLQSLHVLLCTLDRDAKRGRIDPALAVDRLAVEMLMV